MLVYRQILSRDKLVPAAHTGGSGAGWCLKQPDLQKSEGCGERGAL